MLFDILSLVIHIDRRVRNVPYPRVDEPTDEEIINSQYQTPREGDGETNDPVTITGSFVFKPGSFVKNPLGDSRYAYIDAARTAIIFASGGLNDAYTIPVLSAWERNNLPAETLLELSILGAAARVGNESLESEARFRASLSGDHTHPTTPHAGMYASPKQKLIFRRAQIGQDLAPSKPHHIYKAEELISEDGIGF